MKDDTGSFGAQVYYSVNTLGWWMNKFVALQLSN